MYLYLHHFFFSYSLCFSLMLLTFVLMHSFPKWSESKEGESCNFLVSSKKKNGELTQILISGHGVLRVWLGEHKKITGSVLEGESPPMM